MNPHPPSPSRRFTASAAYGLLLASGAFLLTACPQTPPASSPTPAPTPEATPTASAAAATPIPTPEAKYSGVQQMQYQSTAREEFIAQRAASSQPYLDAHKALEDAGGASAKGLASKEAIAARRGLISKAIDGNEQYLNFVKTQEDTYRADLAKTPLIPGDVDVLVNSFASRANSAAVVKLRETERDSLKASDEMMASLAKSFGDWSANDEGRLTFKKKGAVGAYAAAAEKYNKLATEEQKMLQEVNNANAVPSASVPPEVVPGATAKPAAAVSPATH